MVLTSWFPDLMCTGPGSESGTETMQLLFSQHNIACTWLQVQHFFFVFTTSTVCYKSNNRTIQANSESFS